MPSRGGGRLTGAVTTASRLPVPPRSRRPLLALAVMLVLAAGCGGGGGDGDGPSPTRAGPNKGAVPTLAGGVELGATDPASVLVGDGLAYGRSLPSEEVAAGAFTEDPEVRSALARRVFSTRDGRLVGSVLVLQLDGSAVFDETVLDAFVRGIVGALGGATATDDEVAGREVLHARGAEVTAVGYRLEDLLVVVTGGVDGDIRTVVARQLDAHGRGEVGSLDPATPLVAVALDAAFVSVPSVTFEPFPPPEEERPVDPPPLGGTTAVEGRYGVVAGERRLTVWAYAVDLGAFPTAESHDEALTGLVAARAGGAEVTEVEVVDRVVLAADGAEGSPSARAFRHHGLVLLVEGLDPVQLDATLADWLTALT